MNGRQQLVQVGRRGSHAAREIINVAAAHCKTQRVYVLHLCVGVQSLVHVDKEHGLLELLRVRELLAAVFARGVGAGDAGHKHCGACNAVRHGVADAPLAGAHFFNVQPALKASFVGDGPCQLTRALLQLFAAPGVRDKQLFFLARWWVRRCRGLGGRACSRQSVVDANGNGKAKARCCCVLSCSLDWCGV